MKQAIRNMSGLQNKKDIFRNNSIIKFIEFTMTHTGHAHFGVIQKQKTHYEDLNEQITEMKEKSDHIKLKTIHAM